MQSEGTGNFQVEGLDVDVKLIPRLVGKTVNLSYSEFGTIDTYLTYIEDGEENKGFDTVPFYAGYDIKEIDVANVNDIDDDGLRFTGKVIGGVVRDMPASDDAPNGLVLDGEANLTLNKDKSQVFDAKFANWYDINFVSNADKSSSFTFKDHDGIDENFKFSDGYEIGGEKVVGVEHESSNYQYFNNETSPDKVLNGGLESKFYGDGNNISEVVGALTIGVSFGNEEEGCSDVRLSFGEKKE